MMSDVLRMDRRRFNVAWAYALLGGATITITGCGSSSPSSPSGSGSGSGSGTTAANGDKIGDISGNHGHTATITAAQLSTGGTLTIDIRGNATHDHTVSLNGAEVASIAAGTRVAKGSSSNDGHSHTVTFN
jgi:hypothetical protein